MDSAKFIGDISHMVMKKSMLSYNAFTDFVDEKIVNYPVNDNGINTGIY